MAAHGTYINRGRLTSNPNLGYTGRPGGMLTASEILDRWDPFLTVIGGLGNGTITIGDGALDFDLSQFLAHPISK